MSDPAILTTADRILTPALERLYELRPNAFRHANLRNGVYWHPFCAFRGQVATLLARVLKLAKAHRLSSAEGQDLLSYVFSEFFAVVDTAPTTAVGTASFQLYTAPGGGGSYTPGVVPAGTRIIRPKKTPKIGASWLLELPYESAEYETLQDVRWSVPSGAATPPPMLIPVRALREGSHANFPTTRGGSSWGRATATYKCADFSDPSIGKVALSSSGQAALDVAGGGEAPGAAFIRLFAKLNALGQYGPTANAAIAAALATSGVRHFLAADYVDAAATPPDAGMRLFIADQSWAANSYWTDQVRQKIYDSDLLGFGCKVTVAPIWNYVVEVKPTIVLRDKNFLLDTREITTTVMKAIRSYFDDRLDFNVVSESALKAHLTGCHPKILNCTNAPILYWDLQGSTVPIPSDSKLLAANDITLLTAQNLHYMAIQSDDSVTYLGPNG